MVKFDPNYAPNREIVAADIPDYLIEKVFSLLHDPEFIRILKSEGASALENHLHGRLR